MEDLKMLASDCIVISCCCCCQCLILQIVLFVFLKLPQKLVQKTKLYAKKKLGLTKRDRRILTENVAIHGGSVRVEVEEFEKNEWDGCGYCCIEEVEKVLEELSQKGVFAFGSFWGRDESGSLPTSVAKEEEFDYNVVKNHLIETFTPTSDI